MSNKVVLMEDVIAVIPNKYEAVRVMAREARRINSIIIRSETEVQEKPTMMALERVLEGKVKYHYGDREDKKNLFSDDDEE